MDTLIPRGRLLVLLALLLAPAVALAQPDSRTHNTGVVQFDVFNNGKLGSFYDGVSATIGTGFVFNGANGLFEGAVLVGRSASQVSGDVYDYPAVEWAPAAPFVTITPPSGFNQAFGTAYTDAAASNPIGVRVTQRSYSDTGDPFVVVDLDVTNTTGSALTGIYVGLFADWDVSASATNDLGGYDAGTRLLYVWNNGVTGNANYYGVAALGTATVSGVHFDALPGNSVLYTALTTIQSPPASAADRRTVVGTGPYSIGAGQTVNAKFAFVGGSSLANVIANAAAAQAAVGGCPLDLTAADLSYNAATRMLTVAVTVHNGGSSARGARLELDYNRNGGAPQGTRVLGSGTLPAGATVSRTMNIRVPANAPAGNYNFTLRLVDTASGQDCDSYAETIAISAPRLGHDVGGEVFGVEAVADLTPSASVAVSGASVRPNPFVGQAALTFAVTEASQVRLAVYDVLGREVAVLVDGYVEAGTHAATFDARGLAAGTYVYRLQIGSEVQTGRMTLVR